MIIIPDIHGRSFWRESIRKYSKEKIIFLGDYLDPYPYEGLGFEDGLAQLKAVIELKKWLGDQVVLLLGNHDISYLFPREESPSRHDFYHEQEVGRIIRENLSLFRITHAKKVLGRTYLFSHAGLLPGWVEKHVDLFGKAAPLEVAAECCNELLQKENTEFQDALLDISKLRWGDKAYGSVLWADEHEMETVSHTQGIYQIFGHTQQKAFPVITRDFACLDCRMAFHLNEQDGIIRAIENDSGGIDWDKTDDEADDTLFKVIFLDFDGVMHTVFYDSERSLFKGTPYDEYGPLFDPYCIENLKCIIQETDARIVVSSSWKETMSMEEILQMWKDRELPGEVIGVTPETGGDRGDEIQKWLGLHPRVTRYVILDDLSGESFLPAQIPNFVSINPFTGIDKDDAERAVQILSK